MQVSDNFFKTPNVFWKTLNSNTITYEVVKSPFCFHLFSCDLLFRVKKAGKGGAVQMPDGQKPGVQFVSSSTLSDVLDEAKKQNKLVFVDMYTTWCLPCKMMDENVFTDRNLGKFMGDNFLSYKVDAEKGTGPDLAFVYNVKVYPTLLFLDANGRVLQRQEGSATQSELRSMGEQALRGL